MRVIVEICLGVLFLVWGKWFADQNLQPELYGMAIGMAGAVLVEFILFLYDKRSFLKLYWDCWKPFVNNEIRLTIAYLFRIEANGKYLLVKSRRIENLYQPVGGVYKYFYPEAQKDLARLCIVTDNNIPNDNHSEYDLRLKQKDRKCLPKFLNWFFSYEERETGPWREFYEELIQTGILPQNEFGYIYYELIGQHFEPIYYDKFFKIDTFKYADIYIPRFASNKQVELLKALMLDTNPEYIWVTEEEIMRGKSDHGHDIADHTYKIFNTKML